MRCIHGWAVLHAIASTFWWAQVGDVLNYVKEAKIPVNYIAVANPMDREKRKLSLAAPIYAAAHNGLVLPLKDIPLSKAPPLDGLEKVKEQLKSCYDVLGMPRFLNLVGSTESVPACKTTEDVNSSKDRCACVDMLHILL